MSQSSDFGAADVGAVPDLDREEPDAGDMSAVDAPVDMMMTTADSGLDAGDATDMTIPPPAMPTRFVPAIPMLVRGAAPLGSGLAVVGTTPNGFEANESREAVAFHADEDGNVVWAARFGDPSNDQFLATAGRGSAVVAAGVSRGYSVTASNNNDALLVRVDQTGLGDAFNWGTPDDELLFGFFDGGQVAEWIGVGEYAVGGGDRDGLVVAFAADLTPLWASAFDAGADEYFSAGAVVGDTIVLAGSTGARDPGGVRRALVAAVTASSNPWARRSALPGGAVGATAATGVQQVVVTGSLSNGTSAAPAILRFAADGTVSGRRFAVPGAITATNVWFTGSGSSVVTATRGNLTPFVMHVDGSGTAEVIEFDAGIVTTGFLPTPIVSTVGVPRVVLEGAAQTALDVPFSLRPEASCTTGIAPVDSTAVPIDAFESLTLSRTDLVFSGGPIAAPRTSAIDVSAEAMSCGP